MTTDFDAVHRRFYRWSLAVPIVLPVIVVAFTAALSGGWSEGGPVQPIHVLVMIAVLTLAAGGIPYALYAVVMAWRLADASAVECRAASFRAPFAFAFMQVIFIMCIGGGAASFTFGVWALVVGYFYVVLVHAARWLLQTRGVLPAIEAMPSRL